MGNGLSKLGHGNSRRTKKSVVKKKEVLNHQDEGSKEVSPDEPIERGNKKMSNATKVNKHTVMNASELYNLVIAETWHGTPQIAEPDSILLLDCRSEEEYNKAHVVTARHWHLYNTDEGFVFAQMPQYQLIILCGSEESINTQELVSDQLREIDVEHYILDCSVSVFLANYSFLASTDPCTNVHIPSITLKTMPSEIIPGLLYQGNANQATDIGVISSLGISHIVNITMEQPNKFPDQVQYLKVPLDDRSDEDLLSWLPKIISFIKSAILEESPHAAKSNGTVLVHCNLGRSRSSTAVLGYLMSVQHMSLVEACNLLKDCRPTARPNAGFLEQLLKFESSIGQVGSKFTDLPF